MPEIELLSRFRPGLAQMEIGVQTVNPRTLEAIRRTMGVGMAAVEGAVYEFYLPDPVVQEKLQLLLYQAHVPYPHRLVDGGEAVAAPERTASAGLVVQDPVLEGGQSIRRSRASWWARARLPSGSFWTIM